MQFPGTSPSGTFGGATALTDQLRPNSLAQRKQQLIAKLASGQASHAAFPGSGGAGLGQMSDQNSFLASLFGNMGGGGDGQFYGPGGSPSVGRPVDPGVGSGPPPSSQTADPTAPAPASSPVAGPYTNILQSLSAIAGGITGGYNPYSASDWQPYAPPPQVMNPGMRGY